MFEPTVSTQDFEDKYEALLNEYNRVKDQIKEINSSKTIDIEISKYDELIEQMQTQADETKSSCNKNISQAKINELQMKVQSEEALLQERREKNQRNLEELDEKIRNKERELDQCLKYTQLDDPLLSEKHRVINQLQNQISSIQGQIRKVQIEKIDSEKQIKEQEGQSCFILQNNQKNDSEQSQLIACINSLKAEFANQQNVLRDLQAQLNSASKSTANQEDMKKEFCTLENELKQINLQISDLQKKKAKNDENQNKNNQLTKKLVQEEARKKNELKEKKKKEADLKKFIEEMREQKDQLYEEKKKRKSKPVFDPKTETIRLEKDNQHLEKERKRQAVKLKEYSEMRKTYVKSDVLVQVKQKLDNYRMLSKPFDRDIKAFNKLQDIHKNLTDNIKALRASQRRIISEKESQLGQTKQRLLQLIENKTFYQRNISHCKNKLNEYLKEFPDHEKKKSELKEQQKRELAEQKRIKNEQLKSHEDEKRKKKKNNETHKEDEDLSALLMLNQTDKGEKQSIFANQTAQFIGVGAVVALGVAVYSFM